jgi:hypothetical protein
LALINSRQQSADRLLRRLRGDESPFLRGRAHGAIKELPKTLFKAIVAFTHDLLLDRGLPFRWRSYLWIWYIGRYMAARGMLWPFVR